MPGDGIMATMGGAGATRASCFGISMAPNSEIKRFTLFVLFSLFWNGCEDEGRTERECLYIVRVC